MKAGSMSTRESVCRGIAALVICQLILAIDNDPKPALSTRCIGFLLLFGELLSWVISGKSPNRISELGISPRPVRSNIHHTLDQADLIRLSALLASNHLLRHCC
jgi:hypothetical protein